MGTSSSSRACSPSSTPKPTLTTKGCYVRAALRRLLCAKHAGMFCSSTPISVEFSRASALVPASLQILTSPFGSSQRTQQRPCLRTFVHERRRHSYPCCRVKLSFVLEGAASC